MGDDTAFSPRSVLKTRNAPSSRGSLSSLWGDDPSTEHAVVGKRRAHQTTLQRVAGGHVGMACRACLHCVPVHCLSERAFA